MNGGYVNGVGAMVSKLQKIRERFPERVGNAMYQEAQIEMTEAKRRTPVSPVPAPAGVVPGTLRASGRVGFPVYEGRRISVSLSFGGAAIDYAVVQHENPDFHHTTGQWKYLESVLNESRPYMAKRIAKRVDLDKWKV